jgi:hypothetical protein
MFIRNVGLLRTAWRYNPQSRTILHPQGTPRRMRDQFNFEEEVMTFAFFFRIRNSVS